MQPQETDADASAARTPFVVGGQMDDELAEAFGLRVIGTGVRQARLAQGLSQRQLGWRVGLNQSTISRLETGRLRTMLMVTLARIKGVLRLGPNQLFQGEPPGPTRRLPGEQAA